GASPGLRRPRRGVRRRRAVHDLHRVRPADRLAQRALVCAARTAARAARAHLRRHDRNLRTTLDYLVWQLVLVTGKRPGRRTGFPVVRRAKDWEVQSRAALRGVEQHWVDEIEARQPYHRPDRPSVHPLAILDHVNNLNKHRFLPVALLSVEQLGLLINVEPAPGEVIETQDFLDRPIT